MGRTLAVLCGEIAKLVAHTSPPSEDVVGVEGLSEAVEREAGASLDGAEGDAGAGCHGLLGRALHVRQGDDLRLLVGSSVSASTTVRALLRSATASAAITF